MRFSLLLVGVTTLFVVAGPGLVSRAAADDREACSRGRGDEVIAACTRRINSGRLRNRGLSITYSNRGIEYGNRGDNDGAIADDTAAIRLDPKNARAYNGRGLAKRAKGDTSGGDADIAKAKRLDPNIGN
jgi:Flp pilus assembly protein TadD